MIMIEFGLIFDMLEVIVNEFVVKLNRKMVSDLLLAGEVSIELEGKNGKYKLENLSSMTSRVEEYISDREVRCFTLYCTASRRSKEYRVRLLLKNIHGEDWYKGTIIFPSAPI